MKIKDVFFILWKKLNGLFGQSNIFDQPNIFDKSTCEANEKHKLNEMNFTKNMELYFHDCYNTFYNVLLVIKYVSFFCSINRATLE